MDNEEKIKMLTEQEKVELMLELVGAINKFGFELYKQLNLEQMGENIFFSPASISFALAMTYLGARNKTAEEMVKVLHLDEVKVGKEYIHALFKRIHHFLGPSSSDTVLHSANRLYGHIEYSFLQDFLEASNYFYASELEAVDFVSNSEGVRQKINSWVERMTNDMIQDLIPPDTLTPLTRLVIVNAIYFKGDWERQFKTEDTKDGIFHMDGTRTVPIQMMTQTDTFSYGHSSGMKAKVLELPYKGNTLSMLIFLPESRHGLSQLETNLTTEILMNPKKEFKTRKTKVMVKLPKFKMESSFALDETLPELGMIELFDRAKSDLSGITRNNDLFVSQVIHKAYLNIDEKGTEAAAATAVIVAMRAMPMPPAEFIANRPFLFVIKDRTTGMLLFMGRVTQPDPSDYSEPAVQVPADGKVPIDTSEIPAEDEPYVTSLWVDPEPCPCEQPPLRFPSA